MYILAIETSCDETSAAIVDQTGSVLAVETISQIPIHKKYGGVVPEVASRNHTLVILPTIQKVIKKVFKTDDLKIGLHKIDALAVTVGPGLIGSLLVGVNTVKTLGYLSGKKIFGVNHLEGHIYANWIKSSVTGYQLSVTGKQKLITNHQSPITNIEFPALVLIVSGGHTSLIKMLDHGRYQTLGQTLDDAAGEAFDKVAKLLDLPYPGGPEIEKRAKLGNPETYNLPIPMEKSQDLNFSFSGLKTAVLYLVKKTKDIQKDDLCKNFQDVLIKSLLQKTSKATRIHKPKSILLSGGVINNKALRQSFKSYFQKHFKDINLYMPDLLFCTDNAAMIGAAAQYQSLKSSGKNWYDIDVDPNAKLANG
ncbi:MAG: tRNA (adenosine(37)-N6)-threonylcarbamoyltransferase complex transferase subunit TsaD [bacterium]